MGFMHMKIKIKKTGNKTQIGKNLKIKFHTSYAELFQLSNAI